MKSKENMENLKLISSGQAAKTLGMKTNGKDWQETRKLLIQEYGMRNVAGSGMKIPVKNLEKFLSDNYGISKN
jgi:hypothetical protein